MTERHDIGEGDEATTEAPVLLITAWHLKRMRSMPRGFYNVRKLDFATRSQPGCLWVHRWISRRSLMLTTAWSSAAEARTSSKTPWDVGSLTSGERRALMDESQPRRDADDDILIVRAGA